MIDKYPKKTELKPIWRDIRSCPPPKGVRLLFKSDHGRLATGIWYEESGWDWWCSLPAHTQEQKELIKQRDAQKSITIYAHIG